MLCTFKHLPTTPCLLHNTFSNRDKGGGHFLDKSHPEPNPNTLSVKTSPSLVNSPKRGQKKEDGWKEVIRK